jgi:hypothetical protein
MKFVHRIALVLLMAAPLGAAISQSPRTLSLRIDNDAFDFWMQPYDRPDEEYTSGVHITYDGGNAPWWSKSLFRAGGACDAHATECRTARMEIGQDIYTPAVRTGDTSAAPNSRPNAGWLYLSQSARRLRTDRSDEVTITLGVTGPPSLAQQMQRIAHSAAPAFNRPTDWSRAIYFEPGIVARYEQRRRVGVAEAGSFGFDLVPHAGLSAGNVTTAADAGVLARAGWHLSHPWLPAGGAMEVALVAGATGRYVARDLFLDGNTFRDSPRVGHEPLVGSGELGLELRYRWLSLTYRAVTETRAYPAGPAEHAWASMVGGVTFSR